MRLFVTFAVLAALQLPRADRAGSAVSAVASRPEYREAVDTIAADYERFVRELIALTEVPAPPFKEQRRGEAFAELLRSAGAQVEIDGIGNVMTRWHGGGSADSGDVVVLCAHLDTVFPEGTDVTVKREGARLSAPGIGDDTRGLALLLVIYRALARGHIHTNTDILFVADVGEEGEGDLRGAKFLFNQGPYHGHISAFIGVECGAGVIMNGGVGSRRYRVTFTGPGGHSYNAFGIVSPSVAMGDAIARIGRIHVPSSPKTTWNVGVVGGGTSVNTIPAEVFMDVDMRSETMDALSALDTQVRAAVEQAVGAENAARSTASGTVAAKLTVIGDRPAGETKTDTFLVQVAAASLTQNGFPVEYVAQSADANVAMAAGIPAITLGHGGSYATLHTRGEWTEVEPAQNTRAVTSVLLTLLATAGIK